MKKKPAPKKNPASSARPYRTDWGDVADWYIDLVGESGSEYHEHVVLPGVCRLIDPKPGHRMLDVACGQGVLCRVLARRGIKTTGIDGAGDLIDAARKLNESLDVPADVKPVYHLADARDIRFLEPDHYDSAACVLAIQNIHPIQPVFAHVASALKPGGRLVIILMHPCFRGAKESGWGWDDQKKVQYRRVDRYLEPRKSPIVAHPGKKDPTYTWTFHKPIEQYVKSLRNAGLLIDAMEEWPSHKTSGPGPRQKAENQAREEIPLFMAIRAIKVTPPV